MGKPKTGICTYCGIESEVTNDHIPPRSIFPKQNREHTNLVTVPACNCCNNGAKNDDEEFKVFVSMCSGRDSVAGHLLLESAARTVAKNKRLEKRIVERASEPFTPLTGWSTRLNTYSVAWETEAPRRVIARIIRGLYRHHNRVRLPNDVPVDVCFPEEIPETAALAFMNFLQKFAASASQNRIGNKKEFLYLHGKAKDKEYCSFWVMLFYERFSVFGSTGLNLSKD